MFKKKLFSVNFILVNILYPIVSCIAHFLSFDTIFILVMFAGYNFIGSFPKYPALQVFVKFHKDPLISRSIRKILFLYRRVEF